MRTKLLWLMLMLVSTILIACDSDEVVNYESGTTDENYTGNADPVLDVEYKLTEEELENGIQPMELDELTDEDMEEILEEIQEEDEEEDEEDEGSPGPNI